MTNAAQENTVSLDGGQEVGTNDSAETLSEEQAPEVSAPSEPVVGPRNRLQERFSELTTQREQWRAKAQEAEARARDLEIRQQQDPNEAQLVNQINHVASQKPKLEDFSDESKWTESYEQWTQAMYQLHSGLQGYQQQRDVYLAQQKQQEEAARRTEDQRQGTVSENVRKAIASRDDWYDTVFNPDVPSLQAASGAAWEAVLDSEKFADLTYYLAKHPNEVRGLASMSPVRAIRHIAKLESKLAPAVSSPPGNLPPSNLPGKGGSQDPEKMDIQQWMAWRNSQAR